MLRPFFILISFFSLAMTPSLSALVKKEDTQTKIKFYCASWEHMKDELYFISKTKKANPEYHPVSLSVMLRSQLYETVGTSYVPFFKEGPPSPEGKPTYERVARGKVPANCKRITFLFFKSKEGKIIIRSIPDDRKNSPFGSYQFYNLTKLTVQGGLANQRFSIKPGGTKTISLTRKRGTQLPYATFAKINGKKRWLQRNTMIFNPEKHLKIFMIAKTDKRGKLQLSTKGLAEFQAPLATNTP